MRLKSFTAKTMREAMQMVRETLGEDAIIIATREEKNAVGSAVMHITAAIEQDGYATENSNDMASDSWMYDDDDNEAMCIEEVTETMLRHGVPDEILDQIISYAAVMGIDEPRLALLSSIESMFKFIPLPNTPSKSPIMMVGPPGSGKTLAAAKLAARSSMSGLNIAVITTDVERAGGLEQLQAFTKLMDVELKVAKTPTALKEVLLETKGCDQVIIDTAGANPFDSESIKNLARLIGSNDIDPVLVLPASTNAEEAGEIAQIFSNLGAQRLLPTRVDVARRLGSLLTAAYQGGLAFTEVSATARVADGLSQLTSKRLTQLLMPRVKDAKIQNARKAG
jgi:flagellar biosynthesis protein FlhF